ncbi:MAG TPA: hypothetical protein VMD31_04715 [Opitutaceae bacterium]|nr:hypothetical protein [Opitutaceae bacterium]
MLRFTALSLLTAAIWCWQNHRLTLAAWTLPLDYTGDSLENLARIQAASEGDLVPFRSHYVHRLGAPLIANWNEYPGSDDLANFGLGLLARLTGAAAATNVALLLAHLTAAWAFYLIARLLRHRWEWALAGALLFAFSFYSATRGLPHMWLTFTYTVPLALFTAWLVAAGGLAAKRRAWRWLCYAGAVALGASNPYNLFLYLQLLAWAVLVRWLRSRWSPGVRLGAVCATLSLAVFAAIHAHVALHVINDGGTPLLVRNYAGTEIYGLKPIELFVPSSRHHAPWLAAIGFRYLRWSDWRGETFSPYLGIAGAVGLLWMLAAFLRSLLVERRRLLVGYTLTTVWILLFSSIGGINSILAFYFGLDIFRASNRYSIFLFALALLFLVAALSRLSRPWRPGWRLALAALVGLVGLWDQLPMRRDAEAEAAIAEQVTADRALGAALDRRLGPGAMVFQLPILDFPEGLPQLRVNEYDHFRPYLVTRTTRFSYGESKNRARGAWQLDCRRLAPAALVRALESYGFAAIYINRQGYPDNAARLVAEFAAAGRAETLSGPLKNQVVVLLHPAEHRQPPLAGTFTFGRGWNRRAPGEPAFLPHWTNGSASLSYFNPYPRPLRVFVRLVVSGEGPRTLRLLLNGRERTRLRLDAALKEVELPDLELRPGVNRLDLITPEAPIRVSEQRLMLRAVAVHELQLRVLAEPAAQLLDDGDGTTGGAEAEPPAETGAS